MRLGAARTGFGISLAAQLLYAAPFAVVAGTLFRRFAGPWRPAPMPPTWPCC